MGNRAAFGRPGALDRLHRWWYAKDASSRSNAVLCVVIGSVAVWLFVAALARDTSRPTRRTTAARPPATVGSIPPSFQFPTGLSAAELPGSTADGAGPASSTTTTSIAVATTVGAPPQAAATPAPPVTTATSSPPAPTPATEPTADVVFSEGPDPLPTTTTSTPPAPATTTSTTTRPAITAPTTTTTTTAPLVRGLPFDLPLLP